jgi:lipopolysaccharide biosynthesis glycosyltransferase
VADARVFPSAAYLADRLARLNPRDDTEIVLFSDSVGDVRAAMDFGVPASLKLADFSKLPSFGRITGAALFRFFLPGVLQGDVERILYLDTDIALDDDRLFRLFDLDMGGKTIAAVRDYVMLYDGDKSFQSEVDLVGPGGKYLNSGVLLIDRLAYVARGLAASFVDASIKRSLHDQGAINSVVKGDWLELSPALNMMAPMWNSFARRAFPPGIVHFVGDIKPWHAEYGDAHPVRTDMIGYLKDSPWPKFVRHPTFAQMWDRQNPSVARGVLPHPNGFSRFANLAAFAALLRRIKFADVEQGISPYAEGEIPRSFPDPAPRPNGSVRVP